jgi:hypothetical protein
VISHGFREARDICKYPDIRACFGWNWTWPVIGEWLTPPTFLETVSFWIPILNFARTRTSLVSIFRGRSFVILL